MSCSTIICGQPKGGMVMESLNKIVTEALNGSNPYNKSMDDTVLFLESNGWFGIKPVKDGNADGGFTLSEDDAELLKDNLSSFLSSDFSEDTLSGDLSVRFPSTARYLEEFAKAVELPDESVMYITDFLLYHLDREMMFYTDTDMESIVKAAADELTKAFGDDLTFFISWLRQRTKTNYNRDYVMGNRYTMDIQNEAYEMDEYLELLYYLLNEDYIEENDMYAKAADSTDYTDTWLYLSINFICSLRLTDLERIYHPDLPYPPDEVLRKVRNGEFTDDDAQSVLRSITQRLCLLPLTVNKTSGRGHDEYVKFTVPHSCETHFGILFALAEAHRQIDGNPDAPVIRKISTYEQITRYMGEDIGNLFLESDFRSRSATKSYLQSIYMHADEILREDGDVDANAASVKGYIFASLARSHKGSFGEFANTTMEYLKDAKFDGLTPDFVAYELLERGVCSFVSSMLLEMIEGKDYKTLSVEEQTEAHHLLNLSPKETDEVVSLVEEGRQRAVLAVREASGSDTDILTALHRIGSGQAFSKEAESLCLKSAIGKICPYTDSRQCVGCPYEISTKSTFLLVISEIKRIQKLYNAATSPLEKQKYGSIAKEILLPKLDEMLTCIKDQYGEKTYEQYENYLKEAVA